MSTSGFCYVYILETVAEPHCYYVGFTQDGLESDEVRRAPCLLADG